MKLNQRLWILLVFAWAMALGGCTTTPSHLIFHESLVFGADVAVSPETSNVHVTAGYDRNTSAIVPKTMTKSCDANGSTDNTCSGTVKDEPEAMSVISQSYFDINWFGPWEIKQRHATGDAARTIAGSSGALDGFLEETAPSP